MFSLNEISYQKVQYQVQNRLIGKLFLKTDWKENKTIKNKEK